MGRGKRPFFFPHTGEKSNHDSHGGGATYKLLPSGALGEGPCPSVNCASHARGQPTAATDTEQSGHQPVHVSDDTNHRTYEGNRQPRLGPN